MKGEACEDVWSAYLVAVQLQILPLVYLHGPHQGHPDMCNPERIG